MALHSTAAGQSRWSCTAPFYKTGLYRYRFRIAAPGGTDLVGHTGRGCGSIGDGGWWKLTVYDARRQTPAWVPGGVMYQIFPDRFCRGAGAPAPGSVHPVFPESTHVRGDWGGAPEWQPDAYGNVNTFDFFGGNLNGITEKLPYLASLGVTCLYLNPIFLAQSNHRYDTADYYRIDPLLGGNDSFAQLCGSAAAYGIHILLDGVFSHTGFRSVYFNGDGRFGSGGAAQDRQSPYYPWYHFRNWPQDYACWWGIRQLPELDEENAGVKAFLTDVGKYWIERGAAGWRLDVADELPDTFIDALAASLPAESFLLGEVWEDASDKFSHGGRRRYLQGGQMHSVMNYPLADAIIRFVLERDAEGLSETVAAQQENYPPFALHSLMNHVGTHDTVRILNRLGEDCTAVDWSNRATYRNRRLSPQAREAGLRRLKLAAVLQYTLPGNPCVYYGDEAGLEGFMDPFNRGCYPWGAEDTSLISHYQTLGEMRRTHRELFASAPIETVSAALGCYAYRRRGRDGSSSLLVIANANPHPIDYRLDGTAIPVEAEAAFVRFEEV
jgi:glycosidase